MTNVTVFLGIEFSLTCQLSDIERKKSCSAFSTRSILFNGHAPAIKMAFERKECAIGMMCVSESIFASLKFSNMKEKKLNFMIVRLSRRTLYLHCRSVRTILYRIVLHWAWVVHCISHPTRGKKDSNSIRIFCKILRFWKNHCYNIGSFQR